MLTTFKATAFGFYWYLQDLPVKNFLFPYPFALDNHFFPTVNSQIFEPPKKLPDSRSGEEHYPTLDELGCFPTSEFARLLSI